MTTKKKEEKVPEYIKEYVKRIDEEYEKCKRKKISRYMAEWGTWSVKQNREINKRILEGSDHIALLKLVFNYWLSKSVSLEYWYKDDSKRGRVADQVCGSIKKMILEGDPPAAIPSPFDNTFKTVTT